ncbi:MAG: NAD(P)H-dependent oxidoreductase, partial [Deltaproteobacteria bacterium]|nr:NAD(P)H-dependent oxidoreductase [Deltaproteobacteria bacterium]
MKLIGISGSLRSASFNTGMLHAASQCLPGGVTLSLLSCRDLPLYNVDIDGENRPEQVVRFIDAIADCD